jgi:hypothetical protein
MNDCKRWPRSGTYRPCCKKTPVRRDKSRGRPKHDAADLVHRGQKVVGRAAGLHLRSLGDQVVLHLIEADVEHDECDAGRDQRAAHAAAMVPRRLTERDKHAGRAQARQEAQGSTPQSSGSAPADTVAVRGTC